MDKITDFLKTLTVRDYIMVAVAFFVGVLVG